MTTEGFTHQLHIVDSFILNIIDPIEGLLGEWKVDPLYSLMFGVDVDVMVCLCFFDKL